MGRISKAWSRSANGLRHNLFAGVFIWIVATLVYFFYKSSEVCQNQLDELARIKLEYGFLYSACATGLFGGLIPFLAMFFRGSVPPRRTFQWFLFFPLFWAFKGVEVDAFYRLQSFFFGASPEFKVVLYKVLVDQFVYCVIWSAPLTAIFYGWKDADFKWTDVVVLQNFGVMLDEILFLLFSTWIIWIPAVTIVYSMPNNLQIPLFNLTLCFFVLVITLSEKCGEKLAG
jgi:hypothetical protein